ncbi:hypothetical protein [Streptomyces sp. NBC_01497]|uniref:hypothetical protein n=1 Tax=Streptomyces sp. NBC_01497 TaxID=2903885 RepID=UPI002E30424A|nr:hypothetical protein [Streptomyces sp. NBC_01497]
MKSASHLLGEDRAEFERILDEALRTAHERPDLAAVGDNLTARQLRGMALDARSLIAQAAAPEYEHYRKVREESRGPRPSPFRDKRSPVAPSGPAAADSALASPAGPSGSAAPSASSPSAASAARLPRTSVLGDPAATGAGILAVIAVLVPVLAAIAAVIFLLAGYLLKALGPTPPLADALIAFGWFFASVMALGILAAGVGLLITAVRNGSTQIRSPGTATGEPNELADAREEWRTALLERGIVPYLRRTLREAEGSTAPSSEPSRGSGTAGQDDRPAPGQDGRGQGRTAYGQSPGGHGSQNQGRTRGHQLPKMGYSRPDFSSPSEGTGSSGRPRYSSPDFSSPDYGGPDHQPE